MLAAERLHPSCFFRVDYADYADCADYAEYAPCAWFYADNSSWFALDVQTWRLSMAHWISMVSRLITHIIYIYILYIFYNQWTSVNPESGNCALYRRGAQKLGTEIHEHRQLGTWSISVSHAFSDVFFLPQSARGFGNHCLTMPKVFLSIVSLT